MVKNPPTKAGDVSTSASLRTGERKVLHILPIQTSYPSRTTYLLQKTLKPFLELPSGNSNYHPRKSINHCFVAIYRFLTRNLTEKSDWTTFSSQQSFPSESPCLTLTVPKDKDSPRQHTWCHAEEGVSGPQGVLLATRAGQGPAPSDMEVVQQPGHTNG